jgi:hypothetical protein
MYVGMAGMAENVVTVVLWPHPGHVAAYGQAGLEHRQSVFEVNVGQGIA